jgi:hypothetical protein
MLALNAWLLNRITTLEARVDAERMVMDERPITTITAPDGHTRTTFKRPAETSAAFAERLRELATEENPPHYVCTVLSGCVAPGHQITVEHCTPYHGELVPPDVQAEHDADCAAICKRLECTDCGD